MQVSTQHYGVYSDNLDESIKFYTETLDFELLFRSLADEAGIPLKMAWIRNPGGIVIELIEQPGYQATPAAQTCRNHIALRTANMDAAVAKLQSQGVVLETEPFAALLEFDRVLQHRDIFVESDEKCAKLKVAFFRGPSGERFELMQDSLDS